MASLNVPNHPPGADLLGEAAIKEIPEVLQRHGTSPNGLSEAEAEARLAQYGPNEVG